MESPVKTSFIPKQAVQVPLTRRTQPVVSIFTVIAIFIFICAVAASGAVFLYKTYLLQKIQEQQSLLTAKENEFNLGQIDEWAALDKKIKAAKTILANHVAPSRVFFHLEENTLANVRFSQFNLEREQDQEGKKGSMKLTLQGQAPRISTIVVQSEHFGNKSDIFNDPFFHNVAADQQGLYTFSVETYIPESELKYSKRFDLTESAKATESDAPLIKSVEESLDGGDVVNDNMLEDINI